MKELERAYWYNNGNFEPELQKIYDLMPDWGMTDNKYMNLFIMASRLYYDVYNNGGANLELCEEDIEQFLVPFADELKSINLNVTFKTFIKNIENEKKLEAFMDEVILHVHDKDLSYDKHSLFVNNSTEELSHSKREGFRSLTFGEEGEYWEWIDYQVGTGYKFIS